MIFLFWFKNLSAAVVWGNLKSSVFSIKSGVRQGGVCSCLLFNLYVYELIGKLQESGYGCKLWGIFVGYILYADDKLLISSSLIKLQAMLEIYFNFGYDNDLLFNAKKSAYFAFGDLHLRANKAEMYIGEEKIAWVSMCNYLGVSVCSGKFFRADCEERWRKFCSAVNAIITQYAV